MYTDGKFQQINRIDDKLYELVNDNDIVDNVSVPVVAFVTFNSHEAQQRCRKYLFQNGFLTEEQNSDCKQIHLLGE